MGVVSSVVFIMFLSVFTNVFLVVSELKLYINDDHKEGTDFRDRDKDRD